MIKSQNRSAAKCQGYCFNWSTDIWSNGPMDSRSVIAFLHIFTIACDNEGIQKGALLFLFLWFLKQLAAAAITPHLSLKSISSQSSIKKWSTDNLFSGNERLASQMTSLQKGTARSFAVSDRRPCRHWEFREELCVKRLKCLPNYEEFLFMKISDKGLPSPIGPVCEHTGIAIRLYGAELGVSRHIVDESVRTITPGVGAIRVKEQLAQAT